MRAAGLVPLVALALVTPASADEVAADLDAEARAPATEAQIAPAPDGAVGAWLVAGPFKSRPNGIVASAPSKGAAVAGSTVRWAVASSGEGPIDLKRALAATDKDVLGYAAGALHVAAPGRYLLVLGVDDGVRVFVDGSEAYVRDEARPFRDDDDVVPLDLSAGEHTIVLELHQRAARWVFRARITDAALGPAAGAYLRLPGTNAGDARALAARMSWVSLDRAFDAAASPPVYRPRLTVRFPEGAPRGVPLAVSAKIASDLDLAAGGVPVGSAGVSELVVALPPLAPAPSGVTVEATVAGRVVRATLPPRPTTERALARAARALAGVPSEAPWLAEGSLESVRLLSARLQRFVARGDSDVSAQSEEARELDALAAALEKRTDPYADRRGIMRRAIASTIDDELVELGLYVPPSYRPDASRKYPLVVTLHGLNSYPMSMMRAVFGFDDEKKPSAWKDRHPVAVPPFDAFVVTPYARGNTMYRELGEDEVMRVIDWVERTYPIDTTRVSITGPSMGGIGAASIPLHFPHVFSAAAPLCGYHSQLIRHDVVGRPIRPWERFLAEERSNVFWAENGEHLPMWIVHGTRDLPVANSGVLIERYEKLGYSIKHDHPEAGHNVWQWTYGTQKGLEWLVDKRLDTRPTHVRFKTTRTRWGTSAWVTVDEMEAPGAWADVDAKARDRTHVAVTTKGAGALTLARAPGILDARAPVEVSIDGDALSFDEGEPLVLHRAAGAWKKGPRPVAGIRKRGTIEGPLRDVFHEPVLFVYAASGEEAPVAERVARAMAKVRGGVDVSYPVTSDAEFFARGEPLAHDRALFLVGRDNRVLAEIEAKSAPFPIRVDAEGVRVGAERITGREVGAAFIRPNPLRPDRYVVVVAGADAAGTLRALSLPDLVPDFVVWDESLAPARGQILLGSGSVRAAGFFGLDWSLPGSFADPRRP